MAAARERDEDYDVALALDVLAAIGAANAVEHSERDEVFGRLGVVSVPAADAVRANGAHHAARRHGEQRASVR